MKPPLLARALLAAVAGDAEADCIAGDLYEEFTYLARTCSRYGVSRWYFSQVIRSVLPLLKLRVRSGELGGAILGATMGVALPLLLLDQLWRLVYSEIPLKDGLDRAPGFLAVNVSLVCICAAVNGFRARSERQAAFTALVSICAAGTALWISTGSTPAAYALLVLLLAPVSSILSYVLRLRRPV